MFPRALLLVLWTLTGAAVLSTFLLHNYARITCRWRWTPRDSFLRMTVFADPQMEGDSKIRRLGKRAVVDLAFNDAYMRHIYRSMTATSWSLKATSRYLGAIAGWDTDHEDDTTQRDRRLGPTHVSVLGDLFSSQWINDQEFDIRLARYRSIFVDPASTSQGSFLQSFGFFDMGTANSVPILINVTGNHDIGYGNDISQYRLSRWEQAFGKSNFITQVDIPDNIKNDQDDPSSSSNTVASKLHLVVLNTMLLDGPASDERLRNQTWQFIQDAAAIKTINSRDKIVLLTHIPLHKEKGLCVDEPDIRLEWDNTIIEQTMLTPNTSLWILDHLKPDFILNGHDHFGCDVTHIKDWNEPSSSGELHTEQHDGHAESESSWRAYPTSNVPMQNTEGQGRTAIREVTQRSMMAEFGGYAGLLEARVVASDQGGQEQESPTLEFHYMSCGFFQDLPVWIIIVTDAVVTGAWALLALSKMFMFIVTRSSSGPVPTAPSDKLKTM